MTAAAGVLTGLAKLKRQDSARSQNRPTPASPGLGAAATEAAPRKRKRRTDVVVVRGRLRLYSASGFFLLLGLVILAIGIGMATLGYWPQSEAMPPVKTRTGGEPDRSNATAAEATTANASAFNNVQATPSKQTGGALARFLEQHRHSERMKMLGPFTMGIGIFIFICANAILHENRDRETKIIHMRDMYSTVIDIHRLRQREHRLQQQHHHHQRHRSSTFSRDGAAVDVRAFGLESAARLAGTSLLSFSRAASVGGGAAEEDVGEEEVVLLGRGEEEELCRQREQARLDCSLAGLLAPLYKDRPFYGHQGRSHHHHHHHQQHHQWSVDSDGGGSSGHHARSIVSSSISAFTLPVIKLNNCVIDEPEMEAITEEERGAGSGDKGDQERSGPSAGPMESLAVPAPSLAKASKPPGLHRSNSASSSPYPTSACWLSPGAARTDLGSNTSLHALGGHSKSLDLERGPGTLSVRPEQRKHPSWPRLDRSNSSGSSGKGYVRLQDREDHGEGRLLDVPPCAASRRDYSKREKLLMISRSHNNLTFEHDEFNSSVLKRGSSETRF